MDWRQTLSLGESSGLFAFKDRIITAHAEGLKIEKQREEKFYKTEERFLVPQLYLSILT